MGVGFSLLAGLVGPFVAIVIGEGVAVFNPRYTVDEMQEAIKSLLATVAIVGICLWAFAYASFGFMQQAAENLAFELRHKYLLALMRQETEYFERQ